MADGLGGGDFGNQLALMNPAAAAALRRAAYAQALLAQASDVSPLRSPWQAAARAASGLLGGYEMNQTQQQLTDINAQQQKEAQGFFGNIWGTPVGALPSGPAATAAPPPAAPTTPVSPRAPAPTGVPLPPPQLDPHYDAAASSSGIPRPVLVAKDAAESGFNPNAVSATGAVGIGQVLPSTAKAPGYGMSPIATSDLTDPAKNIPWSADYLAARGKDIFGDKWDPTDPTQLRTALIAYNGNTPTSGAYADKILAQSGMAAGAPAPAAGPGGAAAPAAATTPPGFQQAQQYRAAAMQAAISPNPFIRAQAPYLMQQATTFMQMGAWSNPVPIPGTNQFAIRNQLSGETKVIGENLRPDTQILNDLSTLGAKWQQDPNSLSAEERLRLANAVSAKYPTKTEYIPGTNQQRIYQPTPQPPELPTVGQLMGGTAAGGPAAAAGAGAPQTELQAKAEQEAYGNRMNKAQDYVAQLHEQMDQTRQLAGDTQTIRNLASSIQPGWGADKLAEIKNFLVSIGADTSQADKVQVGNAQALQKMFLQATFDSVRKLGAREPGSVIQMAARAFPNIETQPNAIDIMTRLLDMHQRWLQERVPAVGSWLADQQAAATTGGNRLSDFRGIQDFSNSGWDKEHDPRIYSAAALAAAQADPKVWQRGLKPDEIDATEKLVASQYPAEFRYTPPSQPGGSR